MEQPEFVKPNERYLGNPLLKRTGVVHNYTKEEVEEYIKCKNNIVYFVKKYIKIVHVDDGLIPFIPYSYQKKLFKLLDKNRFCLVKQARQSGKTTVVCAYLLHYVLFNNDKVIGILANKGKTAMEILGRVQLAYQHLPKFLQQGVVEFNKSSLILENGSRVLAASTSSDTIRGYSFSLLYIDEAAFIPTHIWDEFWNSVYPTIASGKKTKVLIVSTPHGLNHFYKLWTDAENKRNLFKTFLVTWDQVPGRGAKWKKETIANTSEMQFEQEHNCSFLGSSNTLISGAHLKRMVYADPIFRHEGLDVYEAPKDDRVYVAIVDTSHGVGKDYSAISVIDITEVPYKLVAKYRSNSVSPILFPDIIYKVARDYNDAQLLVENNDVGSQVAHALHYDLEYENLLTCTIKGRRGQVVSTGFSKSSVLGVKNSAQVKKIGCANFKTLLESDKLLVPDIDVISELSTFIATANSYEADKGYNDDLVITLILFAWYTTQDFFKEYTNTNLRKEIYNDKIKQIEDAMTPFGFVVNQNLPKEPQKIGEDKNLWFIEDDSDNDGFHTHSGY